MNNEATNNIAQLMQSYYGFVVTSTKWGEKNGASETKRQWKRAVSVNNGCQDTAGEPSIASSRLSKRTKR